MIVKSPFLKILMSNKKFKDYISKPMQYPLGPSYPIRDLFKEVNMPKKKKPRWRHKAIKFESPLVAASMPIQKMDDKQLVDHNEKAMTQITIDQLFNIADGIDSMVRTLRNSIRQLQRNRL